MAIEDQLDDDGKLNDAALARAVHKNAWRLLPVLTLAFIINYIDRTSVGFAALTMNQDIGISASQFGFGAGLLFAGYCLFEVPSNWAMYRFGARLWLTRIMITWGVAAGATAFVTGPHSFYAMRFLLGVFEAGFAPGATLLLATWFPQRYRARILAWFFLAVPVSAVIAGPVCGLILQVQWAGLKGWQWMFILQALPACIVGVALLWLVTDHPKDATWLSDVERQALNDALASEPRAKARDNLWSALKDVRMFVLIGVQFGFVLGSYGVSLWLPQILKEFGMGVVAIGFLSAIPYVFSAIGMIIWARFADRIGSSVTNLVVACLLSGLGLAGSVIYPSLTIGIIGLTIALIGMNSARAIFWTIPPRFLTGVGAAGGIALINSIGALGGFVGPYMIGAIRDGGWSFNVGILALAVVLLASTLLATTLWTIMRSD
jgi:MFS transporter, ACS family, tartrate transporter